MCIFDDHGPALCVALVEAFYLDIWFVFEFIAFFCRIDWMFLCKKFFKFIEMISVHNKNY